MANLFSNLKKFVASRASAPISPAPFKKINTGTPNFTPNVAPDKSRSDNKPVTAPTTDNPKQYSSNAERLATNVLGFIPNAIGNVVEDMHEKKGDIEAARLNIENYNIMQEQAKAEVARIRAETASINAWSGAGWQGLFPEVQTIFTGSPADRGEPFVAPALPITSEIAVLPDSLSKSSVQSSSFNPLLLGAGLVGAAYILSR